MSENEALKQAEKEKLRDIWPSVEESSVEATTVLKEREQHPREAGRVGSDWNPAPTLFRFLLAAVCLGLFLLFVSGAGFRFPGWWLIFFVIPWFWGRGLFWGCGWGRRSRHRRYARRRHRHWH